MFKRSLIFIHRWLGVALCLLFLLWFPSGIGMMYFPMPSVTPAARLERLPVLEASKVMVSPGEAAEKLGVDLDDLRLSSFDGRPAYRAGGGRGDGGPVLYADTGEEQGEVSTEMVQRVASAWTGQPVSERIGRRSHRSRSVDAADAARSDLSPVFKYSWPNGEQVYVSQATGEVVQYTTTASRIGAYLGPIPHWFYFTPLRKHGPQWSRVVIWSSGIGTISAILGVVIGIWMYSPSRKYRYAGAPTSIPYRGQKRWHTVFGLIFGVATVTYAFSGMLSMDPFPSFNDRVQQRRSPGGEPNVRRRAARRARSRIDSKPSTRGRRSNSSEPCRSRNSSSRRSTAMRSTSRSWPTATRASYRCTGTRGPASIRTRSSASSRPPPKAA